MKYILYTIAIISLLACESPIIEKTNSKHPNGEIKKTTYYQQIDGKEVLVEEKHFYDNGVFKMGGKFLNGQRDGEWKAYFNNEQVQSLGTFKNGKRTGSAKIYYPSGQLRHEGFYEENEKVGHWKFYDESGKLVKEEDF